MRESEIVQHTLSHMGVGGFQSRLRSIEYLCCNVQYYSQFSNKKGMMKVD